MYIHTCVYIYIRKKNASELASEVATMSRQPTVSLFVFAKETYFSGLVCKGDVSTEEAN